MEAKLNAEQSKETKLKTGELPTEFIQDLVNQYRNNQLNYINENLGVVDAHSIWFDLGIVRNFIAEIEAEAHRVDPHCDIHDLGIRLYYGAYSETPVEPIPDNYAKRHTIVMIPTKKKDDGSGTKLDYDFNPFEDKNSELPTALALTPGALGQNHGSLIPPNNSIVESY